MQDLPQWIDEQTMAKILGVTPGCLRNWRWLDRREGRGGVERPGRGGLIWRKFCRSVRYLLTEDLRGRGQGSAA